MKAHRAVRRRGSHILSRQMAVRLSALNAGLTFTPRKIPGTHFCQRMSRPQGHSAAGRIRSIEKCNDIGNRTRHLLACSIVPQPTRTRMAGPQHDAPCCRRAQYGSRWQCDHTQRPDSSGIRSGEFHVRCDHSLGILHRSCSQTLLFVNSQRP
jgi:hypothetical protein